jgi:NADH-quinone oxidoreductase subunit G
MSAQPQAPADDSVNIEVDGRPLKAKKGQMIIQVTDEAGITIPRFCYHKKLPIAANCRMCLIEIERAPKPMPACATPVMEGMKVFTRSPKALAAQRGVMEFLLINHPLDCPICDQGGECELQDLALGFGRGVSRFAENKRVVHDKNVGPLISTDLTRCIHCTRCIRFLDVIAGQKELGATGRGENMTIGTYIERAIDSEMSGNVIDVCPVGALTSKPFRFTARAWELVQQEGIAAHDCVGSNLYAHTRGRGGKVMRVVPRDNEAVNEVWLSDRDRFSYQGLDSAERLTQPMVKRDGNWQATDWETALAAAAQGLRDVIAKDGAAQLGALASPSATLEELYLLQKLLRGLGCNNIDHRLRQMDFGAQDSAPVYPGLGHSIADLEHLDAVLLIGSNVRKEQPIIAHRLRQAALRGACVLFVNPRRYEFNFPVAQQLVATPHAQVQELAGIARALCTQLNKLVPQGLDELLSQTTPSAAQTALAENLARGGRISVLLGSLASLSPHYAALRALAVLIGELCTANVGSLSDGANAAGAWLAGAIPHRGAAAASCAQSGLDARAMLAQPRRAYVLLGVESEFDCHDPALARAALAPAFVVSLTAYASAETKALADVLLPIATFAETAGTFVNVEGRWQRFQGFAAPQGEARPGWKLLRVLGNMLEQPGFEFVSAEQVHDELLAMCAMLPANQRPAWQAPQRPAAPTALLRCADLPPYAVDAIVRRASALQQTHDAQVAPLSINSVQAQKLGLAAGASVVVTQGSARVSLPVTIDNGVPDGCVWIPTGIAAAVDLGPAYGTVTLGL